MGPYVRTKVGAFLAPLGPPNCTTSTTKCQSLKKASKGGEHPRVVVSQPGVPFSLPIYK